MGVVSVRLDDQVEAFLRQHKVNISELAREALRKEVVRMQLDEQERYFAGVRKKPSQPAEKTLRDLRDSRHAK